jgi:hypothetical protein
MGGVELTQQGLASTATIVFRGTTIPGIPRPRQSVASLIRAAGVLLPLTTRNVNAKFMRLAHFRPSLPVMDE